MPDNRPGVTTPPGNANEDLSRLWGRLQLSTKTYTSTTSTVLVAQFNLCDATTSFSIKLPYAKHWGAGAPIIIVKTDSGGLNLIITGQSGDSGGTGVLTNANDFILAISDGNVTWYIIASRIGGVIA